MMDIESQNENINTIQKTKTNTERNTKLQKYDVFNTKDEMNEYPEFLRKTWDVQEINSKLPLTIEQIKTINNETIKHFKLDAEKEAVMLIGDLC